MDPIMFGVSTASIIGGVFGASWLCRTYLRSKRMDLISHLRLDSLSVTDWGMLARVLEPSELEYVIRAFSAYRAGTLPVSVAPILRDCLVQFHQKK